MRNTPSSSLAQLAVGLALTVAPVALAADDPAVVTYECDAFGQLRLSTVNDDGVQTDWTANLSSRNLCMNQAAPLQLHRSRIYSLTLVAICDPFGVLTKLALRRDGSITDLGHIPFGALNECIQQAWLINRG